MGLDAAETRSLAWKLGLSSAVMVAVGYPGEISADTTTRWIFWSIAMIPFLYVVFTLVVGLAPGKKKSGGNADADRLDALLGAARYLTVFSWCTYPVIFLVKNLDIKGAQAQTIEQVAYSLADFLAKAVFGVLIWAIASTKSDLEEASKPKDVEAVPAPAVVEEIILPALQPAAPVVFAQQPVTTSYVQASPVTAAYPTAYASPLIAPTLFQ